MNKINRILKTKSNRHLFEREIRRKKTLKLQLKCTKIKIAWKVEQKFLTKKYKR